MVARETLIGRRMGPLIIESADSTVVIPPEVSLAADAGGNLIADLPQRAPRPLPKPRIVHG